nr:MAG TPA: hypothetical protein [Caudoviricetes sp.]
MVIKRRISDVIPLKIYSYICNINAQDIAEMFV